MALWRGGWGHWRAARRRWRGAPSLSLAASGWTDVVLSAVPASQQPPELGGKAFTSVSSQGRGRQDCIEAKKVRLRV